MEIKKVYYKKLITGDNYSNQQIGAEADVFGDPQETLFKLIGWVDEQFKTIGMPQKSIKEIEYEVFVKKNQSNNLTREIDRLNDRIRKALDFLNAHGIKLPVDDNVPF